MPTYEYKCDNCGHDFEVYQSMKEDKLKKCPNCGKETLRRLIGTGGGLIFKGSGFYLTDYKNKPAEKTSASGSKKTTEKKTASTEKSSDASAEKSVGEKQPAKEVEKNKDKK